MCLQPIQNRGQQVLLKPDEQYEAVCGPFCGAATVKPVRFARTYVLPDSPVKLTYHGFSGIFVGVCLLARERFITYITSLANVRWALLCN